MHGIEWIGLDRRTTSYHNMSQRHMKTRGPMGLYRSPGFCHFYFLSNYDQRMLRAKYLCIYWAPKGATPFIWTNL